MLGVRELSSTEKVAYRLPKQLWGATAEMWSGDAQVLCELFCARGGLRAIALMQIEIHRTL